MDPHGPRKTKLMSFLKDVRVKDVPTSIPKSDLLCVTTAVTPVAGQRFLAV